MKGFKSSNLFSIFHEEKHFDLIINKILQEKTQIPLNNQNVEDNKIGRSAFPLLEVKL